jgi:hypothetical protein
MEEKTHFNSIVTIGFVGHCPIELLQSIKEQLNEISGFDVVFFKVSSGRLWIKEGEQE